MGFAISWFACRERSAEAVLQRLGLVPTGDTEELPDSPVSMIALPSGWRVVWVNEYGCSFLRPRDLAVASQDCDLLICMIEEHVMASSTDYWSNGAKVWSISHEGENGPKGLNADGRLPDCFDRIRAELEQTQEAEGGENAEVDYIFDIPLKVAEAIVGFKHDGLTEGQFQVMERRPSKGGILDRLFGR